MRICVMNFSNAVGADDAQAAVRAINRQLRDDFAAAWSSEGQLELVPADGDAPSPDVLQGDAVIYLCDDPSDEFVGYHDQNHGGVPYGFVFVALAKVLREPWSVALSHETLEMLVDPHLNQLVIGPRPDDPTETVQRLKEVCDPVQADWYAVDGCQVSNFVTPRYFTRQAAGKTDFLGMGVPPFGVRPGGYAKYVDTATGAITAYVADRAGMLALKRKDRHLGEWRRSARHEAARISRGRKK